MIEGDGLNGYKDDDLFNAPPIFKVISAMEVSEKSSAIRKRFWRDAGVSASTGHYER
jgi:hypothetical protein